MRDFGHSISRRLAFLYFIGRVAVASLALASALIACWTYVHPVVATALFFGWVIVARAWFAFAVFTAFDTVVFLATRHAILFPALERLFEAEERAGTLDEIRSHPRHRALRFWTLATMYTNPFTPLLFALADFLSERPELSTNLVSDLGGRLPGRSSFAGWKHARRFAPA